MIDDLILQPVSLTGLSSATLTFDVAYARYDATFNDRLQVVVSDDCGQTFNVVYDKASSVLATDPDQTGAYTAPATWRKETVDMTPFIGNSKVDVYFRNISGYGQFLYIDNVNLTGVTLTGPVTLLGDSTISSANAAVTIIGNISTDGILTVPSIYFSSYSFIYCFVNFSPIFPKKCSL